MSLASSPISNLRSLLFGSGIRDRSLTPVGVAGLMHRMQYAVLYLT